MFICSNIIKNNLFYLHYSRKEPNYYKFCSLGLRFKMIKYIAFMPENAQKTKIFIIDPFLLDKIN